MPAAHGGPQSSRHTPRTQLFILSLFTLQSLNSDSLPHERVPSVYLSSQPQRERTPARSPVTQGHDYTAGSAFTRSLGTAAAEQPTALSSDV